ncbi:MAG TPA: DUF58 domain-containing protein [Candidatus Xenobia bacterium]
MWGAPVSLSPPVHEDGDELAYIRLSDRQVVINETMMATHGLSDCRTAVLAHELGHHLRFPHTMALAAALQVLEQRLVPGRRLTNLFFDLLVNEVVGRRHAAELARIYRTFSVVGPLFTFYMRVYQELWSLDMPQTCSMPAGWEAQARMFAQTFFALPDVYVQFVYFCNVFGRYGGDGGIPLAGDVPAPSAAEMAGALGGNAAVDRALQEARRRGWGVPPAVSPFAVLGGMDAGFRQAVMERHYRHLVERYLFRMPGRESVDESDVPGPTEPWELGDDPRGIDWAASVLHSGALAPVRALQRERLEEERGVRGGVPEVEIFLDVSGSMPAPDAGLNALSLSAQILATAAVRQGGRVRAVVYATEARASGWMYDEGEARRFLLQYSGGGTRFPVELLGERGMRIVISDDAFLWDMPPVKGLVVMLLVFDKRGAEKRLAGVDHVLVTRADDMAGAAARLADRLWQR